MAKLIPWDALSSVNSFFLMSQKSILHPKCWGAVIIILKVRLLFVAFSNIGAEASIFYKVATKTAVPNVYPWHCGCLDCEVIHREGGYKTNHLFSWWLTSREFILSILCIYFVIIPWGRHSHYKESRLKMVVGEPSNCKFKKKRCLGTKTSFGEFKIKKLPSYCWGKKFCTTWDV